MESLDVNPNFWNGKRVFLTGHTGFKGGWLSIWLQSMGAEVYGYALNPSTDTNFFTIANVKNDMAVSEIADIRDFEKLKHAVKTACPEIVFHLAAQPLVRYSYEQPVETYSVNVMGTVHLLEAMRSISGLKAIINVTTDKCYENREWVWGYRENEPMGGFDPYSSSKGCSELITSSYRRSFFEPVGVGLASARAGNVIGGGDWASDRLIPDLLRAIDASKTLVIRSPTSTRPWQHVLDSLSGYLMLAERLYRDGQIFSGPWNFGPADENSRSVKWIVEQLAEMRPNLSWQIEENSQSHEAHFLKLDCSKARNQLNWSPRLRLKSALQKTIEWHDAWRTDQDMHLFSLTQIAQYLSVEKSD